MNDPARHELEPMKAAAAAPEEVRTLFARANEALQNGEPDTAIEFYRRLLERYPRSADAFNNVAVILKSQRRLTAAIACLRRALTIQPENAVLYSNLGNMLWMALELDEAMAAFRRALSLDPQRSEIYHNLGLLYFSLSDFSAAVECFDRALAMKPSTGLVMWDRALALLAAGDYARGFAAYDMRFDLNDPSMAFDPKLRMVRQIPLPLWQGEPVAGRTVYVYVEQGLGDTLQFARFLPLLADRGARVIFDCQRELLRLVRHVPGIAELRPEGERLPKADFHLPLMSLPHRLGITLANLPARTPYLKAPETGPTLPRQRGTRAAVGLVWAGRPQHANDHNRSLPLEELLRLCDIPGVALFSLQKGARSADIAENGATALIHDLGPQIHDFADTAKLLTQMDLLITVDTSVAHLAGALNRPCYLLLPFTPDWRWMGKRADTPWYPSLRLFRQPAVRDWRSVVSRVHEAIAGAMSKPA